MRQQRGKDDHIVPAPPLTCVAGIPKHSVWQSRSYTQTHMLSVWAMGKFKHTQNMSERYSVVLQAKFWATI